MRLNGTLMSSILISTLAFGAAPALAQDSKRTEVADMTAAISRDLGLSPEQVKALGPQQERAIALDEQLQKELGEGFAGSHFDIKSGQLIVNTTDRSLLDKIKGAGAQPQLVQNNLKQIGIALQAPRWSGHGERRQARGRQVPRASSPGSAWTPSPTR